MESYTCMHDGRAPVQQDTLVSIGNRCHTTFHLHLHTGQEQTDKTEGFLKLSADGKGAGEEVQTKNLYFKIEKNNSLYS